MRKFKQAFLGVLVGSLLLSVPALAEEQGSNETLAPTVGEIKTEIPQSQTNVSTSNEVKTEVKIPPELFKIQLRQEEESQDITSSDDSRRIPALEKEYGIEITESMHWSEKYPNYTPMATLKELGYYHLNANRQNLIMYAIQKGDWQPYRAFEAKRTPLYFELVDGKFEYSKIYWGNTIESAVMNFRFDLATLYQGGTLTKYSEPQTVESLTALFNRQMTEYVEKFKAAKGYTPYVIGLNGTQEHAEYWGVPMVENDFFNSKYNHPDVMTNGTFGKEQ